MTTLLNANQPNQNPVTSDANHPINSSTVVTDSRSVSTSNEIAAPDPDTTYQPTPASPNVALVKVHHKRKRLITAATIGVVALVLTAVFSVWGQPAKPAVTTKQTQTIMAKSPTTEPVVTAPAGKTTTVATTAPGIPNYLYQSSQARQGAAIGYLKINQSSYRTHGLFGRAVAAADSPSYQTAIFYPKSDGIYAYSSGSKSTIKVTNGTNPVFSSILQQLATSYGCAINIHDFAKNTDAVVSAPSISGTQPGSECYRPVAWSPDGKDLLFISVKPVSNADIGLVSFSLPYLYNVDTKQATAVAIPDGFNSLNGTAAHWQDAQTLIFGYVQFGKQATLLATESAAYSLSSKQTTKLTTPVDVDVSSVQTAGKTLYLRATSGSTLYAGSGIDSESLKAIGGFAPDNINGFVLEVADDTTATHVITAQGKPGTQGGIKFFDLTISNNTQKLLYVPDSYSSNLIGWGQSYDQLIYNKFISANSTNQIRLYTISSGQDDLLVDNVSLVSQ